MTIAVSRIETRLLPPPVHPASSGRRGWLCEYSEGRTHTACQNYAQRLSASARRMGRRRGPVRNAILILGVTMVTDIEGAKSKHTRKPEKMPFQLRVCPLSFVAIMSKPDIANPLSSVLQVAHLGGLA